MHKAGALLVVAAMGCGLFTLSARAEEKEVKMKFSDCPAAVQKAFTDAAEGQKIETVDKEEEDGKISYEADVKIKDTPYEIKVSADGKLISKNVDKDEVDKKDEKKKD